MDADGVSLCVCQPDRLHASRTRILVHQLGVRVGQPDAPVALLGEVIDAQRLSRGRMVHVQVGETSLPFVEDPHSAVERRDQQPVVSVVPQLFDHVRRQAAAALLRVIDEPAVAAVPAVNSPPLRSDPEIALRILFETADDGMVQPARRGFEIVHAVVREGHVGQFAAVCADPYPAVGIGEDRPYRIVGQGVGIVEVGTQQLRAGGKRLQQQQSRLRRYPDDALRIEVKLLGAGGFLVFERQSEIPSDPAVAVAFVEPVHEREDIYRPVALHHVADHAAAAADGCEEDVLPGLPVQAVEIAARRGVNVLLRAHQRQRPPGCGHLRRHRIAGHGGQPFGAERFDAVVADQPYRPVVVRCDRADIALQNEFELQLPVVEAQQPLVSPYVQAFPVVRDHLSVGPVGIRQEVRDQVGHPYERRAVVHEQGVVAAEPHTPDAVLGDAVDASVIGGLGHGVEAVVRDVQGMERRRNQRCGEKQRRKRNFRICLMSGHRFFFSTKLKEKAKNGCFEARFFGSPPPDRARGGESRAAPPGDEKDGRENSLPSFLLNEAFRTGV